MYGEKTDHVISSCKGVYERRKELTKKILRNPFIPILFIGEFIKTLALTAVQIGVLLTPTTAALFVLAVLSTLLWVFAEHLLDEAVETYQQVEEEVTQHNE